MTSPLGSVIDAAPGTPRGGRARPFSSVLALVGLVVGLLTLGATLWGVTAILRPSLQGLYTNGIQAMGQGLAAMVEAQMRQAASQLANAPCESEDDGAFADIGGGLALSEDRNTLRISQFRTLPEGSCRAGIFLPLAPLRGLVVSAVGQGSVALLANDSTVIIGTQSLRAGAALAVSLPPTVEMLNFVAQGKAHAKVGPQIAYFLFPVIPGEHLLPLSLMIAVDADSLNTWQWPVILSLALASGACLVAALLAVSLVTRHRVDRPLALADAEIRGVNGVLACPSLSAGNDMGHVLENLRLVNGRIQQRDRDRIEICRTLRDHLGEVGGAMAEAHATLDEQLLALTQARQSMDTSIAALHALEQAGRAGAEDGRRILASAPETPIHQNHLVELDRFVQSLEPIGQSLNRVTSIARMMSARRPDDTDLVTLWRASEACESELAHLNAKLAHASHLALVSAEEERKGGERLRHGLANATSQLSAEADATALMAASLDGRRAALAAAHGHVAQLVERMVQAQHAEALAVEQIQQLEKNEPPKFFSFDYPA